MSNTSDSAIHRGVTDPGYNVNCRCIAGLML